MYRTKRQGEKWQNFIKKAEEPDYNKVRDFYHSMTDQMKERGYIITWVKDVHPSPEFLKESIKEGTLYMGCLGDSIASAMVLNHRGNREYRDIQWTEDLNDSQFFVIHALGVHPDFTGKGVGRSMVEEAVRIAAGSGARAVRLDVLDTNEPAKKLYCRCGFEYRGTAKLYYENTGWRNFDMYELCMN